MFQKQHSQNVKSNRSFEWLLLGNSAAIIMRDEGSLFLFSTLLHRRQSLCSCHYLGRYSIKSRTKTQHILTANHRADVDIFPKRKKGDVKE